VHRIPGIHSHVGTDEATSALDPTSRILVFEAVKHRRQNKTTIVITHDLSQILPTDFVYVLKDGIVAEGGYRADLEMGGGEFQEIATTQAEAGGFAVRDEDGLSDAVRRRDEDAEKLLELQRERSPSAEAMRRESRAIRPITLGNWMFEVVSDLTRSHAPLLPTAMVAERQATHLSRFVPMDAFTGDLPPVPRQRRPSTLAIDIPLPSPAHTTVSRRLSLQFSPISSSLSVGMSNSSATLLCHPDSEDEQELLTRTCTTSRQRLRGGGSIKRERKRWDTLKLEPSEGRAFKTVAVEQPPAADTQQESLFSVIREAYPTMPHKSLIALGIVFAIISGAITPIFSFTLARLLFEVSKGAQDVSVINTFGGIVLAIAIADGLFYGLKFIVFETAAIHWVTHLRTMCYRLVLSQDKKWFDRSENAAVRLCQILIRDGDDARSLISAVLAQSIVAVSMLSIGLIWALARGWQLTLVGFAIAPVFIVTMVVQTRLVARCELRNKRAREEVAKGYYDVSSTTYLFFRGEAAYQVFCRLSLTFAASEPWVSTASS
jgi:ATP-binding cassette, subfamily B (MDR/TAP), member 1